MRATRTLLFSLLLSSGVAWLGALAGVADFSLAGNLPLGSVARLELRAGPSVLGFVAPGGGGAAAPA